ncbi:GDP-L-fucose synthase [Virgibacillus litoralis]|uniref:GDP-L-fucose synthase n=1 Tax=Virgibacillus litoralis TaxID=578221 RepID=A0ABS4HJJ2_9BACI|nr:GDP-L-fucose synthase [Virgibacillus litoralis]MBP1950567.1 GDP-L-fucose synthase [Virgibacillus litoralis]
MNKNSRIYVAGHRGLVGSAILNKLQEKGYTNLVYKTSTELDLENSNQVKDFFENESIEYVVLAAAKVGGIVANNDYPADFIRDNIIIQTNVIDAAYKNNVEKLLFLGSTCIYPKLAKQPLKEEYLLTGELEPTNEPYAIAKIAGIKMCESYNRQYGTNFISAMPTNLYGPNDNFDLETSHVLPALIRKFHEAKVSGKDHVELWGSGAPKREFLHTNDLSEACVFLMENYSGNEIINIGIGEDIAIKDLAVKVKDIVGYNGQIIYDASKPDGTPRKLVDVTKINELGWYAKTSLDEGLDETYKWYQKNVASVKL